jgi:mannose-6-phosphate isomerase-like protein (cupin superfamily)
LGGGAASLKLQVDMKSKFPTAQEYSSQKAHYAAMTVVDIRSEQAGITDSYKNQVLFNINQECMRLSVFEEEYRWHHHPDSDELFLVVAGELQIDFESGDRVILTEWQSMVVPAGSVHRTRAIGRTVNITFEKQGAQTVFVEPLPNRAKQRAAPRSDA